MSAAPQRLCKQREWYPQHLWIGFREVGQADVALLVFDTAVNMGAGKGKVQKGLPHALTRHRKTLIADYTLVRRWYLL